MTGTLTDNEAGVSGVFVPVDGAQTAGLVHSDPIDGAPERLHAHLSLETTAR